MVTGSLLFMCTNWDPTQQFIPSAAKWPVKLLEFPFANNKHPSETQRPTSAPSLSYTAYKGLQLPPYSILSFVGTKMNKYSLPPLIFYILREEICVLYYAVCTMSVMRQQNDTSQLNLFNSSDTRKLLCTYPVTLGYFLCIVFIKYFQYLLKTRSSLRKTLHVTKANNMFY